MKGKREFAGAVARALGGLFANRVATVAAIMLVIFALFAVIAREARFASVSNVNTIVLNACILIIMAAGESVVLITRKIDVSIASTLALAAYVGFDLFARYPGAGPILIVVPLLIGAVAGACNGLLVGYGGYSPIIVTLGSLSVFRGVAVLYAGGNQIEPYQVPLWVKRSVASGDLFGINMLVVIAVAVVAAIHFYLRYTRVGRKIYAVGSNPEAADFYGLDRKRIVLQAYVICGALTGLAGYLFGARASYVVPYFAQGLELQVLAAAILGGVSILGGTGSAVGAALGAVMLAIVDNGLVLVNVSHVHRMFVYGAIIVCAVGADSAIQRHVRAKMRSRTRVASRA